MRIAKKAGGIEMIGFYNPKSWWKTNPKSEFLALSVRQPWAWLLMNGIKDIENRTWSTNFRGTIAIHASKTNTKGEYASALKLIQERGLTVELPPIESLKVQGILGLIDLIDCQASHESPWYIPGNYALVMSNPRKGNFMECRGQTGVLGNFKIRYRKYFGTCSCGDAILIPGLDAYLCSSCGWRSRNFQKNLTFFDDRH